MTEFRRPRPNWDRRPSERLPAAAPLESAKGGGSGGPRAGRQFEYSVKLQLERRGFFVIRARASKGKIDLVAIPAVDSRWLGVFNQDERLPPLFLQCKRLGTISSKEWNDVYEIAVNHNAWPVLAMRSSPRTTAYFRLTGERKYRGKDKPMVQFDPTNGRELVPPPTLLDKVG